MPGTDEAILDELEKRLKEASPVTAYLSDGLSPEDIIAELLGCWDIHISDDRLPVCFHCNCSKERTSKVLISLGQKEIREMINEKKPVELHCHFCNSDYVFSVKELEDYMEE